jgi:organic radical activating enzyme
MYCPLPFNHTTISTDGYYNVCCINSTPAEHQFHLNDGDFNNWQKNSYCQEVKQYFADQRQHPGCSTCWDAEASGLTSYRQRILKEYKILGSVEYQEQLLNIEISVGNLCNLSCVMCTEKNSSLLLAENLKLKINKHNQQDFKWNEENFVNLYRNLKLKPRLINLRGGEPFYNKKIFEILDSFDPEDTKNTVIHITTNGTVWNNEWAKVLSKFKLVRLMFSVDAVGDLYNYIRYPGNFKVVENNIKNIVQHKNIKPLIHATLQNLNILYIDKLIQWADNLEIYLELEAITGPDYLRFTNLPQHLKLTAIDSLKDLLTWSLAPQIRTEILGCLQLLEQSVDVDNTELWNKFVSSISMRDDLRGNSYKYFLS